MTLEYSSLEDVFGNNDYKVPRKKRDTKKDATCELMDMQKSLKKYESVLSTYLDDQKYDKGYKGKQKGDKSLKEHRKYSPDTYKMGYKGMQTDIQKPHRISGVYSDENFGYAELRRSPSNIFTSDDPIDFSDTHYLPAYETRNEFSIDGDVFQNTYEPNNAIPFTTTPYAHTHDMSSFLPTETIKEESRPELHDNFESQQSRELSESSNAQVYAYNQNSNLHHTVQNTIRSSQKEMWDFAMYVLSGVILIIILEQVLYLGTLMTKKV